MIILKERNYGIDLLRVLCMFLIVILHVLGKGGILDNATPLSSHYWLAWLLEMVALCSVNCYAIISGYVMYKSDWKISKLFELWLRIIFYTLLITILMSLIYSNIGSVKIFINALFPISRVQYWYLTAYFGLFMLIPIFNIAIEKLEKNKLKYSLLFMGLLMIILPFFLRTDAYNLNWGYSTLWLCLLYLLGGYFAKYDILSKINKKISLILFSSAIMVTFLAKVILEYFSNNFFGQIRFGNIFISFTSPTIILAAIFLFSYFIKFKPIEKFKKVISFLAPLSLSVYIIHVNPLIYNNIINGLSLPFLKSNSLIMIFQVILTTLIIFAICIAIDYLRLLLFNKLKIKERCSNVEKKMFKFLDKYI